MKHYNIRIYGRVQGVFFRDSAKKTARYLGVKGFVKNMPDGSVYIEAEGGSEQLSEFVVWCRKGPATAHVNDVEVKEGKTENFESFNVRY